MLLNGLREIKKFLKEYSSSYTDCGDGFKIKDSLRDEWFEKNPFDAMHKGVEVIELSERDMNLVKELIPEDFSDYVYYRGHFYFANFDLKELVLTSKDKIDPKVKIFDFEKYNRFNNLNSSARAALDILVNAFDEYEKVVTYKESNYVIEKEVETPNEHFDYSYSLTKEQGEKIGEWKDKHFKKYHKIKYKGAIGVSDFELRFRATSIGTYAECVCTECEKEYEKLKDTDPRKAEKIKGRMSITAKGLDE